MSVLRTSLLLVLCLHLGVDCASAATPKVDLVVGGAASALEKQAAAEIAEDLKKIYDAQVTVSTAAPVGAEHVIFVGGPESIPVTKENVSKKWPSLKDQDHFLLTISFKGKPALLVGGQSPQATYWAASEYAHSLGVRSMLYGDLYPVTPKPFSLDQFDRLLTPNSESITWMETDPFPTGITAWGLDESKQRIRQIARLKYSSIAFETHPSQPFAKDAKSDRREQSGDLWFGWRFPVSGDTAGRFAFRGAKFFINPEFATASTYEQRMQAGNKWVTGLAAQVESYGMKLQIQTKDQSLAFRPLVSDECLTAYKSSRNRFGESLSGEPLCSSFLDPISGGGLSLSVHKAFEQIQDAIKVVDENDRKFSLPSPDMILKHYAQSTPAPAWWSKVRDHYLNAMNEMYRVNTRARDGGRSYSLYLARRCEFGYEYINCVDAIRSAAIARDKKDVKEQRAQLEKAVESMNAACDALSAISRDPNDRGMIAILNEFGYRPLQKELEKLDE